MLVVGYYLFVVGGVWCGYFGWLLEVVIECYCELVEVF